MSSMIIVPLLNISQDVRIVLKSSILLNLGITKVTYGINSAIILRINSVLPVPGTPFNNILMFLSRLNRFMKCFIKVSCDSLSIRSFTTSLTSITFIPSNTPLRISTSRHLPLNRELLNATRFISLIRLSNFSIDMFF